MADMLPDGIGPEQIRAAINDLDSGLLHQFGESTAYDVLFHRKRYPPKAVVGIAAQKLTGRVFGPYHFKGGLKSKCFRILEENGFTIVLKAAGSEKPRKKRADESHITGNPDWTRDEHILALDLYLATRDDPPAKDGEEILELSRALNRVGEKLFPPEARQSTFRNPAGVYMKLMNFRRLDPKYTASGKVGLQRGASGEEQVWEEFSRDPERCSQVAAAILASVETQEAIYVLSNSDEDEGIEEAPEGRLLTKRHIARERNRKLVASKIKNVMKARGKLVCEICTFDFAIAYGARGLGFIECHHTRPVSSLAQEGRTNIKDLALVCANCHRIIHRKRPWLSILEVKSLLNCDT